MVSAGIPSLLAFSHRESQGNPETNPRPVAAGTSPPWTLGTVTFSILMKIYLTGALF